MLSKQIKGPFVKLFRTFSSDRQSKLLEALKNQETGVWQPPIQEEIRLDQHKKYFSEVGAYGVSLSGLRSSPDHVPLDEDLYAHHNDISLFQYFK